MTQENKKPPTGGDEGQRLFRLWVDTERRVVSFHEVEGSTLLEFADREMFLRCIDQYTCQRYRYQ